jgi:acyl-CoA synthetase (AMP-forming)/AMP-acid ligase II/acyl carrier protein
VKETNYVSFSAEEVFLHAAPASFDAATFEIWGALLNGGRIVVAPKELVLRTSEFARLLEREKISTLFLTTALFNQLVREEPAIFGGVKQVLFGGEKAEPHLVSQVLQQGPPERLVHVYGPTETTTFATWYEVESVDKVDTTIPIGRPISNTTLYVLNAQGEIVPSGVPGELYIGGNGLAHEYLHQPELTAERFVPHPFNTSPRARLYKTGDLVRYRDDGALEFLGRIDNQVKIRGFRIEPGEIETVLASHAGVKKNVVLAREDVSGDKRLEAYIVPRGTQWPEVAEFRNYLKERLPDYMVPAVFVLMDDLPLSPNGKVDRRALATLEPQNPQTCTSFVPPQSDLERTVAAIWQRTLGLEKVGRDDNFFDLGGQSLLAARITSRIIDTFAIELPVSAIFENPTLAQFSSVIELELQAGATRHHTAVISGRSREAFRVKPAQVTAVPDGND